MKNVIEKQKTNNDKMNTNPYYTNQEWRNWITQLVQIYTKWKTEEQNAHKFYEGVSDVKDRFVEKLQLFIKNYQESLLDQDFLDALTTGLSKSKTLTPIAFLFEIVYLSEKDIDRIKLVEYILSRFSVDEIKNFDLDIDWKDKMNGLTYIHLFCKKDFEILWKQIKFEDQRFLETYLQMKTMFDEIKIENQTLKQKIGNLENEIKYMPGGLGYQEAKENFEFLSNP